MSKKEDALLYHSSGRPGKIQVVPTKPHSTQRDLALAYSPGVAEPCLEIEKNPADAYKYTDKGNLVAVISNGTAVLGLGNIGALAGKPVMEGKGLLFKIFADIDVFDIEVDETDVDKFVQTVKAIAPTFGGINLEDIKAPEAFEIERRLVEELNIPCMHDDQHGTAVISGAALINAVEIVGKKIDKVRLVVNGAGAAAISCSKIYRSLGVRPENIIMCDSKGVINTRRTGLTAEKLDFVRDTPLNTLEEAIKGADVFVGLSKGNVLTPEMLLSMAKDPVVFALANPTPEIDYNLAMATRKDLIMATGRSDTPNQINNVLGFPYIFRGALDVRATKINEAMKIAAVHAIADLTRKPIPEQVLMAYNSKGLTFGREYIIPKPFDIRLITAVAPAVAKAAMDSGVAGAPITDWKKYDEELEERMSNQPKLMRLLQNRATISPKKVIFPEADRINVLRAAYIANEEGAAIPILLGNVEQLKKLMKDNDMSMDVEIIDTRSAENRHLVEQYSEIYWKEHQRNGITLYDARRMMERRDFFGAMMLHEGLADAMINGYSKNLSTATEPLKAVIGIDPQVGIMATANIVNTPRGPIFLADTSVNADPDASTLEKIVLQTSELVRTFGMEPKIALVANSDFGSRPTKDATKMSQVAQYMHDNYPDMVIDGELQPDFALDDNMLSERFPFSRLAGKEGANVLIFPNKDTANLSYKLLKATDGKNVSVGPIVLGLEKAAHLVYTGASTEEILNMVYVAVTDAQCRDGKCPIR
ncbi:MAG: NADP-dependent malic enzyme [Flavobacteriales bacterium]|nr:NADP-dependent malic enzyme [Flavobacteriales bacterium]